MPTVTKVVQGRAKPRLFDSDQEEFPAWRLVYQCRSCGRQVPATNAGIDPNRLVCSVCGARNPELIQIQIERDWKTRNQLRQALKQAVEAEKKSFQRYRKGYPKSYPIWKRKIDEARARRLVGGKH